MESFSVVDLAAAPCYDTNMTTKTAGQPLELIYTYRSTRPFWLDGDQLREIDHVWKWLENTPGMFPEDARRMRRYHSLPSLSDARVVSEWSTADQTRWVKMSFSAWEPLSKECFPHRSLTDKVHRYLDMMAWFRKNIPDNGTVLIERARYSDLLAIRFHRQEDQVLWRMVWE